MRYRLRTLLILMAILPPLLWFGWTKYEAWRAERELRRARLELDLIFAIWTEDESSAEALKLIREAAAKDGPATDSDDEPNP